MTLSFEQIDGHCARGIDQLLVSAMLKSSDTSEHAWRHVLQQSGKLQHYLMLLTS